MNAKVARKLRKEARKKIKPESVDFIICQVCGGKISPCRIEKACEDIKHELNSLPLNKRIVSAIKIIGGRL